MVDRPEPSKLKENEMNVKRRSVFFVRLALTLVLIGLLTAARPTAQAQSVSQAAGFKVVPLSGLGASDASTTSCAQALADAIALCNANFDPAAVCGGDRWRSTVLECKKTSKGPLGVGSTFRSRLTFLGRQSQMEANFFYDEL